MEAKLTKKIRIPVSFCDHTSHLSSHGVFSLFMDLASEHGSDIGLGIDQLSKKGLIWLTVKTKIRFLERPSMLQSVTAETWPEQPGKIRCNRYYTLRDQDRLLVEGKSEWAMLELASGRLQKNADAYPPELEHCTDIVCTEPFARIDEDFSQCPELLSYTVRSTDIDMSQHMNNAAYLRVLFSALSCQMLDHAAISEAEAHFRTQCYEGEVLSVRLRETETGYDAGILKEDGKPAVTARLTCCK